MNCNEFQTLLDTMDGSDIPTEQEAAMDLHAVSCDSCARDRAAEEAMLAADLHISTAIDPQLQNRIMRCITQKTFKRSIRWPGRSC